MAARLLVLVLFVFAKSDRGAWQRSGDSRPDVKVVRGEWQL